MKQHVSFVGAIHIGFGILGLLRALTVFIDLQLCTGLCSRGALAEDILSFLGGTISL